DREMTVLERERDGPAFAGSERDAFEALQSDGRLGDRALGQANVELNDLIAFAQPGVGYVDRDFDRLPGADAGGGRARLRDLEVGVREPVAEWEQRGRVLEQVSAARARLAVVEQRYLAGIADDRH